MEEDKSIETKYCGICDRDLPITDFGINLANKDRRNCYCRACRRAKEAEHRSNLRSKVQANRHAIEQRLTAPKPDLRRPLVSPVKSPASLHSPKIPVADRVLAAIRMGGTTYREILRMVFNNVTGKDEVGEGLAELLLDREEIRTEVIDDVRHYFPREVEPAITETAGVPPAPAFYFSTITFSMPQMHGERF